MAAGAVPALAPDVEAACVRSFEDGAAVFDPVTWQTHLLSREGFELLVSLCDLARASGADPAEVERRLSDDLDDGQDPAKLRLWIRIACHLVAGSARC